MVDDPEVINLDEFPPSLKECFDCFHPLPPKLEEADIEDLLHLAWCHRDNTERKPQNLDTFHKCECETPEQFQARIEAYRQADLLDESPDDPVAEPRDEYLARFDPIAVPRGRPRAFAKALLVLNCRFLLIKYGCCYSAPHDRSYESPLTTLARKVHELAGLPPCPEGWQDLAENASDPRWRNELLCGKGIQGMTPEWREQKWSQEQTMVEGCRDIRDQVELLTNAPDKSDETSSMA